MSCIVLTHLSISTYIWAIKSCSDRAFGSSAIPPITIYSIAVITWVFVVCLCPAALTFRISSIIFLLWSSFGGNWGAEIARTSCACLFTSNREWLGSWAKLLIDSLMNESFFHHYVIRTDLWNNFNFDNAFSYCSKRYTNIKKLVLLFSKCVLRCKTPLRIKICKWDGFQQKFSLSLQCQKKLFFWAKIHPGNAVTDNFK